MFVNFSDLITVLNKVSIDENEGAYFNTLSKNILEWLKVNITQDLYSDIPIRSKDAQYLRAVQYLYWIERVRNSLNSEEFINDLNEPHWCRYYITSDIMRSLCDDIYKNLRNIKSTEDLIIDCPEEYYLPPLKQEFINCKCTPTVSKEPKTYRNERDREYDIDSDGFYEQFRNCTRHYLNVYHYD